MKLALFAGGIWTGLEIIFLAIDILINNPSYFFSAFDLIFHPMFFVSGIMIGIAVYSSLGYGHVRKDSGNIKPVIEPEKQVDIDSDPYLKNRETKIDIAQAIKAEKQKIKRENNE